jgi:hypothetical protein
MIRTSDYTVPEFFVCFAFKAFEFNFTYSFPTATTTTTTTMTTPTPAPEPEPKPNTRPAAEAIPYQGPPLPNVPQDLLVPNIPHLASSLTDAPQDSRLWVPQAPGISFLPLLFSVSQGYFVNLLRVTRSGILSRHRHTGPVHAFTLKGRWHYLEHDWWAEQGGYSYEPSGDVHTLEVPEGVEEMVAVFHVTGAYVYVDPVGRPEGVEDVFSKLESAKEHYERVGLGKEVAERLIR